MSLRFLDLRVSLEIFHQPPEYHEPPTYDDEYDEVRNNI